MNRRTFLRAIGAATLTTAIGAALLDTRATHAAQQQQSENVGHGTFLHFHYGPVVYVMCIDTEDEIWLEKHVVYRARTIENHPDLIAVDSLGDPDDWPLYDPGQFVRVQLGPNADNYFA